jgi:hypothetical protein
MKKHIDLWITCERCDCDDHYYVWLDEPRSAKETCDQCGGKFPNYESDAGPTFSTYSCADAGSYLEKVFGAALPKLNKRMHYRILVNPAE